MKYKNIIHKLWIIYFFFFTLPLMINDELNLNLQKTKQQKKICAAILHPFLVIVFKCETTFFHYFSPRIPNF